MSWDFKKEEDVKQYLENIGIEYRFGCYSEKKPEVCHLLGMYFEVIKANLEKAMKVYKVNCDTYEWPYSCYKYAYHIDRPGKKVDLNEVIDYYKRGCSDHHDHSRSCYMAGVKMGKQAETQKEDVGRKEKYLKAMEYMEKACNQRFGMACLNLSSIHFSGLPAADVPKSMEKVREYSLKGCDNDQIECCVNLSVMYTKGEGGISKNPELAEKYRLKAIELYKKLSGAQEGVKFGEGTE